MAYRAENEPQACQNRSASFKIYEQITHTSSVNRTSEFHVAGERHPCTLATFFACALGKIIPATTTAATFATQIYLHAQLNYLSLIFGNSKQAILNITLECAQFLLLVLHHVVRATTMQIRQSSGFEAALEAELNQLDARFEANEALHATRKEVDKKADIGPTKPHQFWTKGAPYIEGVLGEFARDRVVHLTNADFAHGTLRVLVPCKLVLCESIVFNPNSGVPENSRKIDRQRDAAHDWFPHSQQPAYVVNRGTHSQAT